MLRPVALLAALLYAPTALGLETVRIAIGAGEQAVRICGEALAYGPDNEDARFVPAQGTCVEVRAAAGRITLDTVPWLGEAVRFRAGEGTARDAGIGGERAIRAGDVEVRGDVVAVVAGQRLTVVNVISLEDYVAAVLGSEMPKQFPDEALEAQAVATRTYALFKKLNAYGATFHLGSSVIHQVYEGVDREDARTRAAADATRGEVLTYELAPIEAYFHGSCGGQTETGLAALLRDLPYLQSVDCPCGELPQTRWSAVLRLDELQREFPGADRLEVLSRTATGRAKRVRLSAAQSVDAVELRQRLGYSRVKNLSFTVSRARDGAISLEGKGSGHGAGLCQWGAKALADQGLGYREILAHYYPGAELQQLY
jgi:stage II sporulation protein D